MRAAPQPSIRRAVWNRGRPGETPGVMIAHADRKILVPADKLTEYAEFMLQAANDYEKGQA